MKFVCSGRCLFCYLRPVPDWIKERCVFDLSSDVGFRRMLEYNARSQFFRKRIVDLYYYYDGETLYGDIGDVDYELLSGLVRRVENMDMMCNIESSNLGADWERLKYEFSGVDLTLSVHSVSFYGRARSYPDFDSDEVKRRLLELKRLYGSGLRIFMVVMPGLFGLDSIVEDTYWLLTNGFVVVWFRPFVNKYMRNIDCGVVSREVAERFYSFRNFVDRLEPVVDNVIKVRINRLNGDGILVTSRKFYSLVEAYLKGRVKDVVTVEKNKLFGYKGDDASVGLITVDDVEWKDGEKYYVPYEAALLNNGKDILGREFPENVYFV